MRTVLFWDIDGTLLTTGRAGIFAWEDASAEVLGRKIDLASLKTSGLTDVEVARSVIEAAGQRPDPDVVDRLLRSYEGHLPPSLPRRTGQLRPGVLAILQEAQKRPDVVSALLTGNTRAGARAKLTYYGIHSFFPFGAFADDAPDRPSIARRAFDLARERCPGLTPDRVYVIGDTPHDIHCGKAIGAKTVAVAFAPYTVEDLRKHGPWWVMESLPEPAVFFEKLSRDGADARG